MISVSVSLGEACCDIGFDSEAYSGEIVEDLCKRAAGAVIAMHTVTVGQQAETD